MIFWTQKKKFWQLRSVSFVKRNQIFIQNPRRKTKLQKTSFPHNFTVVHTSKLLTSLPKSFRKLFFAVSTRHKNICGYFKFLTGKLIIWLRRKLFWQPFLLFPMKRLRTFCSKCRSVEKTSNIWRKTIFIRNPAITVNEVLTISMSLFCHNA